MDEDKRQDVMKKHGVDLLYAARTFRGVLTKIDDRMDYGEVRLISLGRVDDECFVVVHTQGSDVTRLITAWQGGRHEQQQYEQGIARRD